jgi:hypothetical protein
VLLGGRFEILRKTSCARTSFTQKAKQSTSREGIKLPEISCIPRKKPQAKKRPSVLSVETAYQLIPSEASQKIKPAHNHFPEATAICHIKRHNLTI